MLVRSCGSIMHGKLGVSTVFGRARNQQWIVILPDDSVYHSVAPRSEGNRAGRELTCFAGCSIADSQCWPPIGRDESTNRYSSACGDFLSFPAARGDGVRVARW